MRSIESNLPTRSYELATLAAARALRSSCCALAHGSVLAKVAFNAGRITSEDIETLRSHGYTDEEIFDFAAAAAARCFSASSSMLWGVQADSTYNELDPTLRGH